MKIKGLTLLLLGMMALPIFVSSCLNSDSEDITYSSNGSITSFSLGTLKYTVNGKDQNGEDSVYIDTLSMADYPFTIDQLAHTIENKDSLPVGTDISKVLTNITADSPYIFYGKIAVKGGEAKDTLWTSTDSIDFSVAPTEGLAFKVYAYSGTIGATYHVKVNVHQMVPDSLQWTPEPIGSAFASGNLTRQKAVYAEGRIYVFGENASGSPILEWTPVSDAGQLGSWTTVELPAETDTYSAVACNDVVYFLASNKLYTIEDGSYVEVSGSPTNLSVLIACTTTSNDKAFIYAQDADKKQLCYAYSLTSGTGEWSESDDDVEFPTDERLTYGTVPVSYNNSISKVVTLGYNNSNAEDYGFVAARLTNDDSWTTYNYEQVDTFKCPNIQSPTMIYYDKKLCLFGGNITSKYHEAYKEPFSAIFYSSDNGLTWKPAIANLTFATGKGNKTFAEIYEERGGEYSCTVDKNNFIWIVWGDGTMSRGRINRYGFAPKTW